MPVRDAYQTNDFHTVRLQESSLQMHWISMMFYETGDVTTLK